MAWGSPDAHGRSARGAPALLPLHGCLPGRIVPLALHRGAPPPLPHGQAITLLVEGPHRA